MINAVAPLKRPLIALLAAGALVLAVASVTVVLNGGERACRDGTGPAAARPGETVRRETSWLPPGTRCHYRAVSTGATRSVAPSPFIFVINLGLGALLVLLLQRRFAEQMRRRRPG
jgi:hypothetical protein